MTITHKPVAEARRLLVDADIAMRAADMFKASAKLWESVFLLVDDEMERRGVAGREYSAMSTFVKELSSDFGDPRLFSTFVNAYPLSVEAFVGWMEDFVYEGRRESVHYFVNRMLELTARD